MCPKGQTATSRTEDKWRRSGLTFCRRRRRRRRRHCRRRRRRRQSAILCKRQRGFEPLTLASGTRGRIYNTLIYFVTYEWAQ